MNQAAPRHTTIAVNQIIVLVRIVLVLDTIAIWLNIPLLRPFLGLLTLFVIPGLLILLLLDIKCADMWECSLLILGLSITFTMFAGLLLNQLFRALNLPSPLASAPVLIVLFVSYLMGSEAVLRLRKTVWEVSLAPELSLRNWCALLLPTLFPILSVAGALILNYGGGSQIAVGTILLISTYVLAIAWDRERISPHILAFSIVMIGLAMLLSFSLRSWHISGWDINQEFYVYQLTNSNDAWLIESFRDPYNACLSITILPTVSNVVLGINDEYVFKLGYQLIFAAVPVTMFVIARKYVSPILAYLASMFFIFQPWFIQPLPALARQEIGLLFFALLIWAIFQEKFSGWQRNTLLLLFGASLIVSHYSTAYIGLGMLMLTLLIRIALKTLFQSKNFVWRTNLISGWALLILCALTFYWSSILTGTSGNVVYVAQATLNSMRNVLLSDLRSEDIRLTLGLTGERFDINDINSYVVAQSEQYSSRPDLYPPDTYRDFVPRVVTSIELTGTLGNQVNQSFLAAVFLIVKQLTKILLILGAFTLARHILKSRGLDLEYGILNLTSLTILFLFIVLPVLSLYYNLFRIYIQTLIVSSVSLVIGANLTLSFLAKPPIRARLIGLLLVVFFISSSGVASYLVGGPATMNLNNFGEDYDKFYTHDQEVFAARWLFVNRDSNAIIYADETTALHLISFGNVITNVGSAILPSTMTRDSYVYLGYANIYLGITEAHNGGKQISYNYPLEFLERNKNLIYDNGGAQIYK